MQIPPTTCKERYNLLMKQSVVWDKALDLKMQKSYIKHREAMWELVGKELGVPWRAVEDHALDLGKKWLVRK
jgi:hypothetical protein